MPKATWQELCASKRAERDASIPKEWLLKELPSERVANVMNWPYSCGAMSAEELAITELDATELLSRMAAGHLKSYDVVLAFCRRAAIAQQLLNCLTMMFVEEALERAKELDEYREKTGKVVGPYHGLPFSIKDQFAIKAKESNTGIVSLIGQVPTEDAVVVRLLREAGAVFYCKTTQPQSKLSQVYGRTLNPFNRNLTCGGSSGGEGALVAFRGSPIGLAADIGGSIRSPAANNGLYGAKITAGRVPLAGIVTSLVGYDSIPVAVGPVCRSARDNAYFFKTILATEPWRVCHDLVPLSWRSVALPKKLTVALLWDDEIVKPHPPVTAALKNIKAKLQSLPDHFEIVDWQPFQHAEGYEVVRSLYFPDGGKVYKDLLDVSGEPALPLTEWVLKESHVKEQTIADLSRLNGRRDAYRAAYLSYWAARPSVDFIVAPVGPGVAPAHETARYWGYTAVWNILDWPAYAFPTGESVSPELHPKDLTYQPRNNEFDAYNWANYDPVVSAGAPISLQLVGRKWDDERVVEAVARIAAVIEAPAKVTRSGSEAAQPT
ncbi:hypothetical protein A1O3_07186 [Capronia epimyces CBS 606.96]|uniref:amidase n=1 Tax=Capronia epimyces CBS 606.96 TaxID=1182542 RepID=W9XL43_9EURO|nr:uncharacterized protein A1O3_07186 [Capronia epimyces CBS 606.96]EXJ80898.1 hypothetical protein A1O3_07186 [Capronia epimyces CBS 606.96]